VYRGAVHYSAVKEFGIEEMYEEVFRAIQTSLPEGVVIPDEKLFYATTLYNFEYGFVPALIGDGFNGFIRER
jgi:hypothetical protein